MVESQLMGYVRKSKNGNALNISISVDAFERAEKESCRDGQEFVRMIVNTEKIKKLIDKEIEVTGISQIVGE